MKKIFDKTLKESVVFDGMTLVRMMDLYVKLDEAYTLANRAVDKCKDGKDYFMEISDGIGELLMPIEAKMNELEETDGFPNSQLMNKWLNIQYKR
jgi:hypothetical protein